MNNTTKNAAMVLRAVNNRLRIRMMDYLRSNSNTTVTQMFVSLRLEQSVASQHLAILRKAGIVKVQKEGKFRTYSLNNERISKIKELSEMLTTYII